jgi:hypothetical protein
MTDSSTNTDTSLVVEEKAVVPTEKPCRVFQEYIRFRGQWLF